VNEIAEQGRVPLAAAPPGPRRKSVFSRRGRRPPAALRIFGPIRPRTYVGVAVLSFLMILGLWWGATAIHITKEFFLPPPDQVWERFRSLVSDGSLWADTRISFERIMIGFLISTAIGLPVGVLIGTYRYAEAAIEPVVDFVRYMPAVAFVPLTIVWAGVGETQKYMIIFIGTFFQQVLMVMDNVKRVPRTYVDIGRTLGMSDVAILGRIVIPAAGPALWDTLRITIGWAWTWLIVAELVAANTGLGHRIVTAERFFQTDTIFVGIIVIGILGLIIDQVMKVVGARLFRYATASH
jgi:NitT/TauT family transport system permease protein